MFSRLWLIARKRLSAWHRGYQSRPSRAVDKSKLMALGLASGLSVAPLLGLWLRIYRTVIVLLQIVCIWRLPPAVLCCHSDCQSGSDWLAGVVALSGRGLPSVSDGSSISDWLAGVTGWRESLLPGLCWTGWRSAAHPAFPHHYLMMTFLPFMMYKPFLSPLAGVVSVPTFIPRLFLLLRLFAVSTLCAMFRISSRL